MASHAARNVIYGRTFAESVLTAYGTNPAAALLVTPKVRLFTDPGFIPLPTTLLADLAAIEANFTGYTAGGYTPTFTAVVNAANDVIAVGANVVPRAGAADPQVTDTVYGWWLDNGTVMVAAERFPDDLAFDFTAPGDFLDLFIVLPMMLRQLGVDEVP